MLFKARRKRDHDPVGQQRDKHEMFTTRIAKIATTALATSAFGLAAFGGAATASASSVDDEFLTNIDAEGIAFDSARAAIEDAHLVCSYLADGETGVSIGGEIMDNTDLSAHQAAVFVVEAASAYCPGYLDQMA
jgi:hypothetical protein